MALASHLTKFRMQKEERSHHWWGWLQPDMLGCHEITVACQNVLENHVLSLLHTESDGRHFPEILANSMSVKDDV